MPCYHDNIADNNWFYGNNLLNKSSKEHNDLMSVGNFSINTAMLMGLLVGDSVVVGGEAAIVGGSLGNVGIVLLLPIILVRLMWQISNNIGGSPKPNDPWLEVGKKLKKTWDDLNNCAHNKDYKGVVKNIVKLGVIAFVVASAIFESLGKEGKKAFLDEPAGDRKSVV